MQKLLITILLFVSLSTAACSIYRPPVQQGNLFTQEMVSQLHIGMGAAEVKEIMGSPMLVDGFNRSRWTYYYRLVENGKLVHEYRVILTFSNGRLSRIEGEAPAAAVINKR